MEKVLLREVGKTSLLYLFLHILPPLGRATSFSWPSIYAQHFQGTSDSAFARFLSSLRVGSHCAQASASQTGHLYPGVRHRTPLEETGIRVWYYAAFTLLAIGQRGKRFIAPHLLWPSCIVGPWQTQYASSLLFQCLGKTSWGPSFPIFAIHLQLQQITIFPLFFLAWFPLFWL